MFILIFFVFSHPVFAGDFSFYFIYPGGEGDSDAAKPYINSFYEALSQNSGKNFTGEYFNDVLDAVEAFKSKKVDLAIVSPEFYDEYSAKYNLKQIIKSIPIYSTGPYEKFYIMAYMGVDFESVVQNMTPIQLVASQKYRKNFLNDKLFYGDERLQKMPWTLQETTDILAAIKKVAAGQQDAFVLLTGYEFFIIKELKKKNKEFGSLKLFYTSQELPSSPVVVVGDKIGEKDLELIKTALLKMPDSLNGLMILKKLRLKGFSN